MNEKVMIFMDKPKSCLDCVFYQDILKRCELTDKDISDDGVRSKDCPMLVVDMHRMDAILKAVTAASIFDTTSNH